ncbi:LPXTG cell wall anchor domain-containing protein [Granulicella sp. 5B5]|uniref:ABC transporter permease n=1 Tax=Granulicella sp. 5B5 TaxID=1617967 RepID=UPI0015F6C521|nr:ABC transporter permease [Granulicella sp. 5B5]QMV18591.1 LPXTG cell wall anchor domain-containing protein [Granulicella sp. 5B5]
MSTTAITFPVSASRSLPQTLRIFLTETRYEFQRLLRTRSFALSVIGFPVVFYIFFGLIMNRGEHIGGITVARYMLAGYTVFGMVGAALFGIGVGLSAELSAGWLELKRASPMPPLAYLFAKCMSAMAFGVIIVSLLTLLGITAGGVHLSIAEFARMMALTIVGVIPFAVMGMALALLVPAASAPGIANMIYLPMSFLGGLWIPIMFLPKVLQHFAVILPTYHLAQLQLASFGYPSAGSASSHWIGLIGFTLIMLGIALIAFRRIEQNS